MVTKILSFVDLPSTIFHNKQLYNLQLWLSKFSNQNSLRFVKPILHLSTDIIKQLSLSDHTILLLNFKVYCIYFNACFIRINKYWINTRHSKNQDNDIWTKVVQGLWSHNLEWSACQIEGFFHEQNLFQKIA